MKLSSKTHYGLICCHFLGRSNEPVSAKKLESLTGISGKYLERIMRTLASREIVSANRGVSGGYYLARTPEEITVGEIVRALEDDMKIIECVTKDGACKCCPSQKVWQKLYNGINDLLDSMTLKQMIDGEL